MEHDPTSYLAFSRKLYDIRTAQPTSTGPFSPLRLSTGTVHPFYIYGTAFQEDRTGELKALALKNGFRGVDSANYSSAYEEPSIRSTKRKAPRPHGRNIDKWGKLHLHPGTTKFTPIWAHAESKLPYNADQPLENQVHESIEQSFQNLKLGYIDALLLHAPFEDEQDDTVAWHAMESLVPPRVGVLGVSNSGRAALEKLYAAASVKPKIAQNRFQEENEYDADIREYLDKTGIVYQAFSLLKANQEIRSSELVARVAERFYTEREIAFYMLVLGLGKVSIVNGTTSEAREMDLSRLQSFWETNRPRLALTEHLAEFKQLLRTK
ncbi:NADP-dependent oxidoreductase domain protein [Metarhizium robertsii ARSEF 23]|uniref:NADP-dependent oxidoreductase domain protein n=1 Tax=Metarhizium robertsii (strain ARSEF 23 / ATCC MYA-3075) TaxID=655844 RepID=E9EMH3_METRA|nr:NADP-dependent oxidoreductase domain protein [Metarhizium robertsii ARSEF 23]EFZ03606.2 NADP-dependent oxidoreductase domain protein [Metarhizium robertsii ARSEF 23]